MILVCYFRNFFFTFQLNFIHILFTTEITIFAILALLGAIVLTLIGLTIVVATKSTQLRSNSAFGDLPDVVSAPPRVPLRMKAKNPVTKVSRMSRAIFSKTTARDKVEPKVSKRQQQTKNPRPPLAIPVHTFESYWKTYAPLFTTAIWRPEFRSLAIRYLEISVWTLVFLVIPETESYQTF